ncbi:MAG: hypothetical protein EOP05_00475 [Proteobacteria bacterium]|nr:MAG: hypothetical protein EOP05_00475 [Pseudomonadota bacterium]
MHFSELKQLPQFIIVLIGILGSIASSAAKTDPKSGLRKVCTVTINSSQEKKAFQTHLPSKDFEFIELTEIGKTASTSLNDDWFQKACKADIQCDVLVVSGHFAGSFFGNSKLELGLDEMERNSCRNSCDGILKSPKEVFLFGCNTLAEKKDDSRSYSQYVTHLVNDLNYDEPVAIRAAQGMYGAMGSSFKQRMRRVFKGVPNLYGFDAVGPTGAAVKPYLDNYFKQVPNYLSHVKKIEAEKLISLVSEANSAVADVSNTILAESMRKFAFAECSGVLPNSPDSSVSEEICQLHRNLSLGQKAEAAARMLKKPDRLTYLPSVLSFIRSNEVELNSDPEARAAFEKLKSDKMLLAEMNTILSNVDENPYTKVDLLRLKLALVQIDQATFELQIKSTLTKELRRLDQSTIDLACSLRKEHGIGITLRSNDIDLSRLETNQGVSAFACLRTDDPKISARIIGTFRMMSAESNPEAVAYGLEALMNLPSYEEERAAEAKKYVTSKAPRIAAKAQIALASAGSSEQRASAIAALVALPFEAQDEALESVVRSNNSNEALAQALSDSLSYGSQQSYYLRLRALTRIAPTESALWKELATKLNSKGIEASASAANYLRDVPKPPTSMAFWALENMNEKGYSAYFTSVLAKMELRPNMISKLADQIVQDPTDSHSARLRYILRSQRNTQLTDEQQKALSSGPVYYAECLPNGLSTDCSEIHL